MIGLVVNPVAGIGGTAGLAGSDGDDVQRRARERGAVPRSAVRAVDALRVLAGAHPRAGVVTAAGEMGEDAVRRAGLRPVVVFRSDGRTTGRDTRNAAAALVREGADLVLFAGGDGTARDVASGIPEGTAALGIPAGVKMYSPVFAVSPRAAGGLAAAWLTGELPAVEREVLDVDEVALRTARVEPRLFGMLRVPFRAGRTQARKVGSAGGDREQVRAAARGAALLLRPGVRYLLGPGGTMAELAAQLGLAKTPLGVDVVLDGRIVRAGASESDLLDEIARGPSRAVVTIIGGQGFLLGRGNQQLSARVIRALGDDPLIVVATQQKLLDLDGRPLLVDTGDPEVDAALAGFARVVTAASTVSIYPVSAPEHEGASHAP